MIKANFSAYSKYVTDSLWQWDQNRTLTVTGLNLTVKPEVHFSNANLGGAVVVQADMVNQIVSVPIPNSLLMDPLRIYAHIGIYEGDEFKVVELVEIPVIPRKRPADYQLAADDFELYSFKRLENMIQNINDTWVNKNAEQVQAYVTDWLDDHPEATTTVQDHSLTVDKMVVGTLGYVTPEMFGAKGDGVTDDTAAFTAAAENGLPLVLDGVYAVSAVSLPLHVRGKGTVKGTVTFSADFCRIEGVTFSGTVNFDARNSVVTNCSFQDCAFAMNKWANSFNGCGFYRCPITFAIKMSGTNNFVHCYFSSESQFLGTPANLHITGGWIEECTNMFDLVQTATIFGVVVENCDIETCENLFKLGGSVSVTDAVFSNCTILGNSVSSYVVNTDDSTLSTNYISVDFQNCHTEGLRDFNGVKSIEAGLQGLPQSAYSLNVPYDNDVNISWNMRHILHEAVVPAFEVKEASSGIYEIIFRKPVFIGTVTCDAAVSITADRCINGTFPTTTRTGSTGAFNSTCYALRIAASAKPAVTITTSGNIYGGM